MGIDEKLLKQLFDNNCDMASNYALGENECVIDFDSLLIIIKEYLEAKNDV